MAWAEQQRSGRWTGKYRAHGRVRSAGTFSRKPEAERAAAVAEDKARRDPTAVDPRDGRMTWAQWREQWQPRRAVEPTTRAGDTSFINHRLMPRWGDVPLTAIRREDIQDWVLELTADGLGAWSVHHCYRLLSNSLTAAVIEKRINASPCIKIKLPVVPDGDERFLTGAEVSAIAQVLEGRYRTLLLLLVGSGMRWGEAIALHWARVSMDRERVDVVETWDPIEKSVKPYTKGRKRRSVWLPQWLVTELEEHRETHPPEPRCGCRHRSGTCRSGLVIPGAHGGVVNYHSFRRRQWGRAVGRTEWETRDGRRFSGRTDARKAVGQRGEPREVWTPGLARVDGEPIEHATIHDTRHTFASWSQQAMPPMSLYELSRAMGHSSIKVTERYAHLAEESRDRFQAALAWPVAVEAAPRLPRNGPEADTA